MPLSIKNLLGCLLLSGFSVALVFALQWQTDFNLWDEGFLWYGAQRVLAGDVPILDFQAYDPARYYWAAAIMRLLNSEGIVSLRVGAALCQTIALFLSLQLICKSCEKPIFDNKLFIVVCVVLLMQWMYVYYKVYDIVAAVALIAMLASLIEKPTILRYFLLGICIGFVATIGRNHGVYGLIGCAGAIVYINVGNTAVNEWLKHLFAICVGIFVGFAPVWVAMLTIDGYATAFLNSVYYLFELKTTNLPLPVPWPWRSTLQTLPIALAIHGFFTGLYFVALLVFPVVSITWILITKIRKMSALNPGFIAAAWLSVPYAHYAFSRADVPHLSFSIFPLLIGSMLLLKEKTPKIWWSSLLGIFLTSALLMIPLQPLGKCLIVHRCVEVNVAGDVIRVPEKKASEIRLLQELVEKYVPRGGIIFVTPSWPGAYPLLGRKSPVYDIYNLSKRSDFFQQKEIEKLAWANPMLVVMVEELLDGGDAHLLKNTNPLIHSYLLKNYTQLPDVGSPTVKVFLLKVNTLGLHD